MPVRSALVEIVKDIVQKDPLNSRCYPEFNEYRNEWEFTASGIRGKISYSGENTDTSVGDAPVIDVELNDTGHLFCGRAAERAEELFAFFPLVVIANSINFMLFMGALFQKINYIGMVDVGLAVTGIKGAMYDTKNYVLRHRRKPYEANIYKEIGRIDALSLLDRELVKIKSEELLVHLFRAFTQGHDNPFDKIVFADKNS